MLNNDIDLEPFYQTIQSDIKQLSILEKSLNNWDKSYNIAQNLKFVDWPRKKIQSEIKEQAKEIRDIVKTRFNKKREAILVTSSRQAIQDLFEMYQILKKLENLIIEFDNEFTSQKREKNIVDFTDVEHLA